MQTKFYRARLIDWIAGSQCLLLPLLFFCVQSTAVEPPAISASFHTLAVRANGTAIATLSPPSVWPDYGQGNVGTWSGLRSASIANSHSVGLLDNGRVLATGDNFFGQCNVSTWTDIRAVAAVYQCTLGLRSNGTVVATGGNSAGQLNVGGWTNIVGIAAGGEHTLGLRSDGTVVAVGTNRFGQCNVTNWSNIVAIAAGSVHSLGLKTDGTVLATGTNLFYGETNVGGFSNIVAISAGSYHSVGLKTDGTVVAAGANWADQCAVGGWSNIVAIAGGFGHTVGLKADFTVITTGENQYGQSNVWHWYLGGESVAPIITFPPRSETALLGGPIRFSVRAAGPGTVNYRWLKEGVPLVNDARIQGATAPTLNIAAIQPADAANYSVAVSSIYGAVTSKVVRLTVVSPSFPRRPNIAAGVLHTIGLKANGTMLAAGNNDYGSGQTNVGTWNNIRAIAAGEFHSVGTKSDGTVLGTGWTNNQQTEVGSWQSVVKVAASVLHTIGLRADGTVVSSVNATDYGRVSGWSNIVDLAASETSSLGLMSNGTAVGAANCNGLRDIIGACRAEELSNVVQVAVGNFHAVGLRADGTVIAVGSNYFGACLVSNWTDIVAIAAGSFHTVGLRSDGTVVATGTNYQGECNVSGWSNIVAIAASEYRTVGLKADDTAIAVGRNGNDVATWYLGTNLIAPIITEAPTNQTVFQLRTATLSGAAAGPGQISYQWLQNGMALQNGGRFSGTTNRMLFIARVELSDSADYSLVAISPLGRTTSSVARLEVILPPAISVSSTNTGPLTFDTLPPPGNWFWASIAGAGLTTTDQLDAAVQVLEIGIITNLPVTTLSVQPGSERHAYWNATSRALQTRPGGGASFVALMATVQNDTATTIDWLHIAYDVSTTPGADAIAGFRVYFSTTGEANSWQLIPGLSTSSTGAVETSVNMNCLPGQRLFLLWADSNTPSLTDPLRSIDNLRLTSGIRLSIRSIGPGQFDITWPASVTGYFLHARTNLHSAPMLVEEPDTPDDQLHHVVVTNLSTRFFHLQQ